MKVNVSDFIGKCECGQTHGMAIRRILLEPGAIERLPEVCGELGLTGKALIICDSNTWEAAARRVAELLPGNAVIRLEGNDIHPNEKTVAEIEGQYPAGVSFIVGVGGGVITDTSKYIGKQHGGTPVVLVPTAASVDGFAANSSVMTFNGFKHPLTTQAAAVIIADTTVLAAAPYRLTASGLGDLLGKYIALGDWRFANIVTGEALCPRIFGMVDEAVERALKIIRRIRDRDGEAVEALMYALILSGLTIQMWGNARPASGAEHMIAHVWELALFSPDTGFLHGETVGVGTIECRKLYEKLFALIGDKPQDYFIPYKGFPHGMLRERFGEAVCQELMPYNNPDEGTLVDYGKLTSRWGEIKKAYAAMPSAAEMEQLFRDCGMKVTLEDLGLDSGVLPVTLEVGSYVRGRMTLYRAWHCFTDISLADLGVC
jgi:glycerol-1-phosphate dehydrogenase [NAD(P)+]